ncbi:hypothetical protein [Alkalihalobacillus sp. TS-13]|uniref:hypothetical protein n=1 Tax=Alkalihalobacillus sp. TS-13 TaxID=2842455 RepID=UPI001C86FDAB|nr:hypothetical protein [Alkalihalobacillus sp. TS-13]
MATAQAYLSNQHALSAKFDGHTVWFTGADGHNYVIKHNRGEEYKVQGPGISKIVDISHLMGDNNGVWLANETLKVLGFPNRA